MLKTTIEKAIIEAMKAKDATRLRGLRGIKSAIMMAETEKGAQGPLTPERELTVLQKLKKQRQDALDMYVPQGREDLAIIEREEMVVIEEFMPAQLSEDELTAKINEIVAESAATGLGDLGKVIGKANGALKGQADGKRIAEAVKAALSAL